MKTICSSMFATLGLWLGLASSSLAITVNVDFGLTPNHPGGATSVLYSGTAAAPDLGTTWNSLEVEDANNFHGDPGEFGFWTATKSVSNLLNSQGAATTIGVTAVGSPSDTGAFGILEGSTNLGAVATDAVNLMRDYLIGFGGPQQVILNGFTPGTPVDLYLYGAGDTDNRDTVFSVTDINGAHSATTTGTITGNGGSPVAHTLTLGGDYVVLQDIVANVSGTITILYDNGAGSGEAPFNGLQAVYEIFTGVPGDVNGDLLVTLADYQLIRDNFRRQGATRSQGDLTNAVGGNFGDGVVDFYDFLQWQDRFTATGGVFTAPVPEPATGLLAVGVLALLAMRVRRS